MDWGRGGVREAAARAEALIIVDTLSFSSAVVTAVQGGAMVYPCAVEDDAQTFAKRVGAEIAVRRSEVPEKGRFSLSPLTFLQVETGTRVVLSSPNGATCSRYGRDVPYLFVGTLLNAQATADTITHILNTTNLSVTVIAAGERWRTPSEDGDLRYAVEDYLGAGAILSYLDCEMSPEAQGCAGAFLHIRDRLEAILWDCASGRELREIGYGDDVRHCAQLNLYDTVPVMRDEALVKYVR